MKIPLVDLGAQFAEIEKEVMPALREACVAGSFVLGPAVESFEQQWADYCETRHCVAVNSGTSALHLALCCLDVGPGDEVVTTSMTFVATASAISYVGATPVFVDIDPAQRTLDPSRLEAAITPRTKAIVPVHLYGMPANMEGIGVIADRHGIAIVEDAAQAHGARYHGRRVGGLGRIGCFSFYPSKNLGGFGEGGALVTNDGRIAARARALRDHGQIERRRHSELGYNYRMDGLQGIVLTTKLKRLDAWNRKRAANARLCIELLENLPLVLPLPPEDSESAWHLFVIEVNERDRLHQRLTEAGIVTGLHYPVPVHLHKAYAGLGLRPGTFPVSENLARGCLSLPIHPELGDDDIRYICCSLREALA